MCKEEFGEEAFEKRLNVMLQIVAFAMVCLPLVAPIGLSPLHIPTLCGSERVLVVSTEPLDDVSCYGGGVLELILGARGGGDG